MRFDSQYQLEHLDTLGVFSFEAGDDRRVIAFRYETELGIPEDRHDDATALFIQVAAESRRETE